MSRRIMNVTAEFEIGKLRERVMAQAGFQVRTFHHEELGATASGGFDVLLLCYSVPTREVERLASQFRMANPSGCVIAVLRLPWDPNCDYADECVQALEGPDALIKAAKECKPKASSAAV